MPRAGYFPKLDFDYGIIGDAANPLTTLRQKQRHNHTPIRYREPVSEMDESQRHHVLRRHCRARGRHHDYQIDTREGRACIWCGHVDAELA